MSRRHCARRDRHRDPILPDGVRPRVRRAEARLAVNPRDADGQATVAVYYAELGRRADARRAADRAATLDPPVDAEIALAGVYTPLGDTAAARRWLRQALSEGYPRDLVASDPSLAPLLGSANSPAAP